VVSVICRRLGQVLVIFSNRAPMQASRVTVGGALPLVGLMLKAR
jgi:hypothetical protein